MPELPASLLDRTTPAWFDEAKLGIFIHWTPAAIPAFAPNGRTIFDMPDDPNGVKMWRRLPYAEMYQTTLHVEGSLTQRFHAAHYGDRPFDDFVHEFRDEMVPRWDPAPWAEICARAGARYVVFTTQTEDGFLLWPSATPNPHKARWQTDRDVVGELAGAVRDKGLRFGAYYCAGLDYTFLGLPITDHASFLAAVPQSEEYVAYADAHWRELVERYEPHVLWNDIGYPRRADLAELFGWYVERVPEGVINNRFGASMMEPSTVYSDFVTPEYTTKGTPRLKWETCRGIGASFGYNRYETSAQYMTSTELVHLFVDVVARGGNLLINLGPTATGEIPWEQAQRLSDLGWWLQTDGDAIYGTRPWVRHAGLTSDGLDVRYTATDDAVHAIVLGTPMDLGRPATPGVDVDLRLDEGARVSLVGRPGDLAWTSSPAGVRVELPEPPHPRPAMSLRFAPAAAVHPFEEV